ncbi:MAG TPA: hypothetical protein DDX54_00460 [Rhodospirillaceae bacterium]|jgi:hypothetical protein|nr:hypothetical protein [Alphaproteobacteria bacterium]HBH25865.1 hypothetical protein [Rhodospirillaceae bacterium]
MSDVNARDTRPIERPQDVWPLYQGCGDGVRVGAEVELAFFDPASPCQCVMTPAQNAALTAGRDWLHKEPTAETVEIATRAVAPGDLPALLADAQDKIGRVTARAASMGLKRSYFQDLPACTADTLLRNLVDVPRYRAFFGPPRADMADIAAYFAVCKSNQVSVSYRDPDHMLSGVRRLYLLAPFLFLLTDNTTGFAEGKPHAGHSGMHHRTSLGARGGVPPYVFTARDGEEYLRAHIDHVWRNPLFVYYGPDGALVRVPSGRWESFGALAARGLGTAANYFLAQSVLWPDVKIAALPGADGAVAGHRYEARMFGVGAWQHAAAALIVAGLACNDAFAAAVDDILSYHGVTAQTNTADYAAARAHGGFFFETLYGEASMVDFACAFGGALSNAYVGTGLEGALEPLLEVCCTGETDGQVNRKRFPTLDACLAWQREYDPDLMADATLCARAAWRGR